MIIDVKIPEVGESITEGTLTDWLKQDGDLVRIDEPIFTLETDKITLDIAAPRDGKLSVKVQAGSNVKIGQVVGTIDTEAVQDVEAQAAAKPEQDRSPASKPADPAAIPAPAPVFAPAGLETLERKLEAGAPDERLSPAVHRLVREHGLETARIDGTGKDGRITKADVLRHLEERPPKARDPQEAQGSRADAPGRGAAAPAKTDAGESAPRQTRKKMTRLRQRIAERLLTAVQTTAMLTTFNEADLTNVIAMRNLHKEAFEKQHGVRLGYMSFFVKAAVDALKAFPQVNARIDGDEMVTNHFYDIGVAIGTEQGLVVPVVRDCDRLSFAEIELAIADYARKVRERTISIGELTGGVFTITNGGVYGSLCSTPILNPPQSAILGMHAIKKRPVAVGDQVAVRPMMYVALSYDHRVVDGRDSVQFLKRIIECIENPERLLLEV